MQCEVPQVSRSQLLTQDVAPARKVLHSLLTAMMTIISGLLSTLGLQAQSFQVALNRKASWTEVRLVLSGGSLKYRIYSKALSDFILSPFHSSPAPPHQERDLQERTLKEIQLDADADWTAAWEKNLDRQTLYNNIVKEVFNSFTRILGWHFISVVLYELLSLGTSAVGRADNLNIRQVREISHPSVKEMSIMNILEKTQRK